MKKVAMTKYVEVDGWGNCVSACICTLLSMDIDDIPEEIQKKIRFQPALIKYLAELGYEHRYAMTLNEIPEDIGLFLVTGTSNRKYVDGRPVLHLTVYSREGLYHDPHPSGRGLDKVKYYEYLLPRKANP